MVKPVNKKQPERRRGPRRVDSLLPDVGGVAFKKFGFAKGALLGRWKEVVGPVYARWSVPESIRFPRGKKAGATLTIRVEGPFATQLQHAEPQLISRVNLILGAGLVAKIRLVQGSVPPPPEQPKPAALADLSDTPDMMHIKSAALRTALQKIAGSLKG